MFVFQRKHSHSSDSSDSDVPTTPAVVTPGGSKKKKHKKQEEAVSSVGLTGLVSIVAVIVEPCFTSHLRNAATITVAQGQMISLMQMYMKLVIQITGPVLGMVFIARFHLLLLLTTIFSKTSDLPVQCSEGLKAIVYGKVTYRLT